MSLVLTQEQKIELKRKILEGEIDPNGPEAKQLLVTRFNGEPLAFAANFLKDHCIDQGTNLPLTTPAFHHEMMNLYLNCRFIGLAAPRGHAKSTVTTLFYVLYAALYLHKRNIVIISATEEMAVRFLRRIKQELESNPLILWAFGAQRTPDKWAETEIRLQNGVVIHAKGQGAQLRGLIEGALRPDLVILDDIEDDVMVRSETRRQDLESWFNGAVLPTLEPKTGQVIIVGTILHQDSLLNRIVSRGYYPDFTTKIFAALDPETDEPLWPERFSKELLDEKKASYIARNQLAQFYMEYMNDPVPQEAAEFKQEHFCFFELADAPKVLSVEIFIDLGGGSTKSNADDTAMVVVASDERNTLYVLDYISDKMGTDTEKITTNLFQLVNKWKPHRVCIEKTQAANFFVTPLTTAMSRDKMFFNVEYIVPPRGNKNAHGNMSDAKYQRISAMAAPMKFQEIKIQRWMTKLIDQLLTFPRGKHDDIIDALAYAYLYGRKRLSAFTKEEEEELTASSYEPLYDDLGL